MDFPDVNTGSESVDFWVNQKDDYFRWICSNQKKVFKKGNGTFLKRDILLLLLKKSAVMLWEGLWEGKKLQVASSTWN